MKLTLAIPIYNQLNDCKGALGTFRHMTSEETEWLIIDNGSDEHNPVDKFIRTYLKPKRLNLIRNNENLGLVKTYQQIYENCETELLAISHNDVFIYEKDWDKRVISYFEQMPDLGAAGFFGVQGCGPIGERIQDTPYNVAAGISNMLEAEIHGMRLTKPWNPAAIFDGFMMVFRMETLKKSGGFDQRYQFHHIYDRDASLESLRHGYKNIIINVPCHHLSGLTANRTDYQTWIDKQMGTQGFTGDKTAHDTNSEIFKAKWKDVLPLYVEPDFSYRTGVIPPWEFKGDAITTLPYETAGE